MARYLKDNRRVVIEHKYQKLPEKPTVWSDRDFAGCRWTRRSTSGGVDVFGKHCIKTYSQTQETVALSSGESEFYGIAKVATMESNADPSTAKSIASRRRAGRVRHLEVLELWVQDRVAKGELEIKRVKGEDKVADD